MPLSWIPSSSFLVAFLLFVPTLVCAQTTRGTVVYSDSDGEARPLVGASVFWKEMSKGISKGTTKGVYTDSLGRFELVRSGSNDTLVIRAIGYQPIEFQALDEEMLVTMVPTTTESVIVEGDQPTILRTTEKTEFISEKQLKMAACCSLAESFEKSPSVEVSYSDAASGARQIQMLGLRGLYTQVLIEAVPMVRALEMPFGLEHIPGPFMESVSISKGAGTVTNGYDAITGLINVCYHNPRTAPALFVNAYGNTNSRAELNVYGAQHVTDELSTLTMLHGRIMPSATDKNADGFADQPTFKQVNAVHRWYFNNDMVEWQVFVRGILDNYEGGQLESVRNNANRLYQISTDIKRLDGFVKFGVLDIWESMPGSGVSVVVAGATHEQRSLYGESRITGDENTLQVRGVIALPFSDDLKFLGGLTYLNDHVRQSITHTSQAGQAVLGMTTERTEHVPGVYSELTASPVESLVLIGGLRYDWHNLYGSYVTPRLHAKYSITEYTSVRASVGRGWRVPSVIIENMPSFISSRQITFDSAFRPEEAWNLGASITTTIEVGDRPITADLEVYRTQFQNQVVIDFDRSPNELHVTNLSGESYATSVLAQVLVSPFPRVDVLVAYRWQDVQAPYNGTLQQKPMTSRSRVLTTLSYTTPEPDWQFDATVSWNSGGRLPSSAIVGSPTAFEGWWRVNGQVTKKFTNLDLYLGAENLTDFIQNDAVVGADNPYGPTFDASLVWGPLDVRLFYLGVRYTIE